MKDACHFCRSVNLSKAFLRLGRTFFRCLDCRAFVQLIEQAELDVLATQAFAGEQFLSAIQTSLGDGPDWQRYREFEKLLPAGRLLEIGAGSGHFLAAARQSGREVECIELSATHRDYIQSTWGLPAHPQPVEKDELPPNSFDAVVSFNCIEHILDPIAHLKSIRRVLRPSGRVVITTCNADCLVASIPGGWWSMFKQPDHVSIGSSKSYSAAAARAGLTLDRISFSEYPWETPIGLLVAARDAYRERRRPIGSMATGVSPDVMATPGKPRGLLRQMVSRANNLKRWISPAQLTCAWGVSGAIVIVLHR
ncbi:MAG: class I SAM-dependent methyltransferase [Deltaproteobacteria bacterium]